MRAGFAPLGKLAGRAYGIHVTLEPAIGALVGAACPGQEIRPRVPMAIACVTIAAVGIALSERHDRRN